MPFLVPISSVGSVNSTFTLQFRVAFAVLLQSIFVRIFFKIRFIDSLAQHLSKSSLQLRIKSEGLEHEMLQLHKYMWSVFTGPFCINYTFQQSEEYLLYTFHGKHPHLILNSRSNFGLSHQWYTPFCSVFSIASSLDPYLSNFVPLFSRFAP